MHLLSKPSPQSRNCRLLYPLCGLAGVGLLLGLALLQVEGEWFQSVGYGTVLLTRCAAQGGLGLVTLGLSWWMLGGNLAIAHRHTHRYNRQTERQAEQQIERQTKRETEQAIEGLPLSRSALKFSHLLPLTIVISLAISLMLVRSGQLLVDTVQANGAGTLNGTGTWLQLQNGGLPLWSLVGTVSVGLLLRPAFGLGAIVLLVSVNLGIVVSQHWATLLAGLHATPFPNSDPVFGQNISFYVFTLPIWQIGQFGLFGLSLLAFLSTALVYLLSGNSLSQGFFPGLTVPQRRHLYRLGAVLMLAIALHYGLARYDLLNSPTGVVYGASYTNLTIERSSYTILSGLAVALMLYLFAQSFSGRPRRHPVIQPSVRHRSSHHLLSLSRLIACYVGLVVCVPLLSLTVQRFIVQPNELQLEKPYLQYAIAATRQAFNLEQIEVKPFNPDNRLTAADLQKNTLTVQNIRLWDTRPLLETNRQLQRIRSYYEFPGADIDRYLLPTAAGTLTQQQVLISARELDYQSVPAAAQTWVNQHLIYTHGYGFTLSPVNVAGPGGLPDYFVQGIEPFTIADRVRNSIPIGKPRIYYGELTDTYVMTQTNVQELDYPSGSDNIYNTYDGRGGIALGGWKQRLLAALYLRDWNILFTDNFTPQTKLLFRRNIQRRVQAIAPFLHYDSDPYLVVADTGDKAWQRGGTAGKDDSFLYWMIDAYTTSDRYPYSDPQNNEFNYIRNSVKVVIDAYHGSVNFYIADDRDPIIQTWQKVFPDLFQPLSEMPDALRQHIRYPQDLYRVLSEQIMTYHMTDPVVFYNREDQWRAPNEIYGTQQQVVTPYYLIMKLPTGDSEEFILLRPFTPAQRNNLIAWLAARSDETQYGKLLLYVFPKQQLLYGPEQIEARINQDPIISQRISLWNRQGSRAVQGNLLVIPIEQSLLYVEPLYLEAEQNQLPTLAQVIVVYSDRIVMAGTLEKALKAIFQPIPDAPTIIRPVEEEATTSSLP